MAKKRMVDKKLMNVDVTATGSGIPYRRSVYIVIGAEAELNGVRKPAQAPIPPARIAPLSEGRGKTCRAQIHKRSPPPIQSSEASAAPTRTHPQCSRPRPRRNPGRSLPYTSVAPKPAREARTEISKPRSRNFGVSSRGMGDEKIVAGAGVRPTGGQSDGRKTETARKCPSVPRKPSGRPHPHRNYPETCPRTIFLTVADTVIRVVNARQNNLQGVTVDLPHRALTVITGPSGSGKSSLAFDTLYAEGQRRYIESLSTYAKQFLERMPKPLVDRLEGIAPSVAIEQRNPVVSSRSTVGTATEVYDHLRLLWARVGRSFCRACGAPVRVDTPQSAADDIVAGGFARVQIAFPLPPVARLAHAAVVENLRALGFVRVVADGDAAPSGRAAGQARPDPGARTAGGGGPAGWIGGGRSAGSRKRSQWRSRKARESPWRFTTAAGCGSPARRRAAPATRPPPR